MTDFLTGFLPFLALAMMAVAVGLFIGGMIVLCKQRNASAKRSLERDLVAVHVANATRTNSLTD